MSSFSGLPHGFWLSPPCASLPTAEALLRRLGHGRKQAYQRALRIPELSRPVPPRHIPGLLDNLDNVFEPSKLGIDVVHKKLKNCRAIGGRLSTAFPKQGNCFSATDRSALICRRLS